MRVLHINSGRFYGGVEVALERLHAHRGLAPEIQPEYAVCFEGRGAEALEAAGATVHRLGRVRASRPLSVLNARRALRDLLRRGGYDLAITHLSWPQALLGPAVRSAGRPLVAWYHDPTVHRGHPMDAWARRTRPALMLCNSRYSAGLMRRYYPRTPIEVLSYPVDPPPPLPPGTRAAVRAEHGVDDPAAVVILQGSRWQAHKGQLEHVEALGRLADQPGWVCWMTGAPQQPSEITYQDQVRAAAERLGIADRVRFLGWQPDLDRLRAAADIYCQPNAFHEPFGLAFIEAMHAGLPVVATRLGGPAETVDASCGVLVAPKDVDGLARELSRLIADPAERARLGAGGPSRARELCDPSVVLGRLEDVLTALTGAGGPAFSGAGHG